MPTPKKSIEEAISDFEETASKFEERPVGTKRKKSVLSEKRHSKISPPPITLPCSKQSIDLSPESSDFVVFAINHIEKRLDDLISHANERTIWAEQRDEEQSAQLDSLADIVRSLNEEIKQINKNVSDVTDIKTIIKSIVLQLEKIENENKEFHFRLVGVEQCKSNFEKHVMETKTDHFQLDRARMIWAIVKWGLISLSGIAGTIVGIIVGILPILEHFSK